MVKYKAIKCQLCKNDYLRITNTHLWAKHRMTFEEYKQKFPDAPLDAIGLADDRVRHLKDNRSEVQKGNSLSAEIKRKLAEVKQEHGGTNYRQRALEHYGLECARCGLSTDEPSDFIVHHYDNQNINSELGNHSLENLGIFCRSCHGKLHNEINHLSKGFTGLNNIEKGFHYILRGLKLDLGLDLKDENFTDTPKRVARAYYEIFSGVADTQIQVQEILKSAFPKEGYGGMVLVQDIEVFGMCPHHFLPVHYIVSVAYLPASNGTVLGVSKLARLVDILVRRPIMQEKLTTDITDALMSLNNCQGAACLVHGEHYCMKMRGVRSSGSTMVTSSLKGAFLDDIATRNEFMTMLKLNN